MLSHKYPKLDYLVIGAGTGGATVPMLQELMGCEDVHTYPRLKSYTYTDISSYFFQRAAEKFEDFSQLMNFKKLDVEQDPETGLQACVIRCYRCSRRTPRHIRHALHDGTCTEAFTARRQTHPS